MANGVLAFQMKTGYTKSLLMSTACITGCSLLVVQGGNAMTIMRACLLVIFGKSLFVSKAGDPL